MRSTRSRCWRCPSCSGRRSTRTARRSHDHFCPPFFYIFCGMPIIRHISLRFYHGHCTTTEENEKEEQNERTTAFICKRTNFDQFFFFFFFFFILAPHNRPHPGCARARCDTSRPRKARSPRRPPLRLRARRRRPPPGTTTTTTPARRRRAPRGPTRTGRPA